MSDPTVTLFHAPHTRSSGVLFLLEELEVPYKLHVLDQKAGEHRAPAFLAVNPMGKVPALLDGTGAVVTEQVAIMLHLADLFPAAELAPPVGDPLRGPYLRWMVFYAGAFEPAVVDRAAGREPAQRAMSPYGEFDTALDAVVAALVPGPYLGLTQHPRREAQSSGIFLEYTSAMHPGETLSTSRMGRCGHSETRV